MDEPADKIEVVPGELVGLHDVAEIGQDSAGAESPDHPRPAVVKLVDGRVFRVMQPSKEAANAWVDALATRLNGKINARNAPADRYRYEQAGGVLH